MMRLLKATQTQRDAAFNVVFPKIEALARQYVPPFFQWQVQQKLEDPNTKAQILQIIDQALDAAENAQ